VLYMMIVNMPTQEEMDAAFEESKVGAGGFAH
jgi:hypothetical protein